MVVELLLLQFICQLLVLPSTAVQIAKPGCRDRCGNLWVPYPFGMGAGCYREASFAITCNESYNSTPKAFLQINTNLLEVQDIHISPRRSEIVIINKIYPKCYNNSNISPNMIPFNVNFTPYRISYWNELVAIGCNSNISARIRDPYTEMNSDIGSCFSIGCNIDNISDLLHTCSSGNISCCSITRMSEELKELDVELYTGQSVDVSSCNYVFPLHGLYNRTTGEEEWGPGPAGARAPVRLEWAIEDATSCDEARRNLTTAYACGGRKNHCNDGYPSSPRVGYTCGCDYGFLGNPYLPDGCEDDGGGYKIYGSSSHLLAKINGKWLTLIKARGTSFQ